jgi:ubiquinone/menaquinone biosynthesis C-methylase UbiE
VESVEEDKIKKIVRKGYAKVAKQEGSCCGGSVCTDDVSVLSKKVSKSIGYSDQELGSVPEGANMGLGCGTPLALASLKEDETVLDLGSGGGLDCFLAANEVGEKGKVIGVDMTPEMIDRARENARKGKWKNVEFRLGEIENLPVADNSVDVVISNCVINLSANKPRVFEEAFRVLKPGGRLMVSDIVQLKDLPAVVKKSVEAYVGCLSGALKKSKYLETIKEAGFEEVNVMEESQFPVEYMANDPTAKAAVAELGWTSDTVKDIANAVASVKVYGKKPKG